MGWYGDYKDTQEVMNETLKGIERNGFELLDTKIMKTYAMTLYKDNDGIVRLDSFIFRAEKHNRGTYKPIYFLNDYNYFNRVPKKWLTLFNDKEDKEIIAEQKEILIKKKEEKKKEVKLDDILEVGKHYLIWNEHKVTYAFKQKRSHVFKQRNGSYTRFRKLSVNDIQEIK